MNTKKVIEEYIDGSDWRIKENSNMDYSLQGMNNHIVSHAVSEYWLDEIYEEAGKEHKDCRLHIHDLGGLSVYCVGWDLKDVITKGFTGVPGKNSSAPPKHLRSALGQLVNFLFTLQGEAMGAQAVSSFDTYLAPFVRADNLNQDEVKQSIQEFVFNMNVPTRTGFQCVDEETEILTDNGWKKHDEVNIGDSIKTFNMDLETIESKIVRDIFHEDYSGEMLRLSNRETDQLITPNHKVVRRKPNKGKLELIDAIDVLWEKSPLNIPVATKGYDIEVELDNITLAKIFLSAWIISEGSVDRNGSGVGRISIYQQKGSDGYERIHELLDTLGFDVYERDNTGEWGYCAMMRLNAEDSKTMYDFFGSDKKRGLKFIPSIIKRSGKKIAREFLDEFIRGDGNAERFTTSTVFKELEEDLSELAILAGYSSNTRVLPPNGTRKKALYAINFNRNDNVHIEKSSIEMQQYNGIVWCPNTENGTIIAKRNGKVFITGNSPFSNLTMDITPTKEVGEEHVIIGGEVQKEQYKDFQKEIDMINIAFCDVMMEGDSDGRVFTFPIPTYNIVEGMDWDTEVMNKLFKMTGKYGIPYFANFINSDMDPEDVRSMCCRIRIQHDELKKRGGGLFGSAPLTGSIGIVTINLPRIGYEVDNKEDFFKEVFRLMDIAKRSLIIKRELLEKLTKKGLYPYSRFYLDLVHQRFGEYWKNHFSTIGLIGVNETALNLFGKDLTTKEGQDFGKEILIKMRDRLLEYQEETGDSWNLEATPAEGTTRRFASYDKKMYDDIIIANQDYKEKGQAPYYTNSSQLPVGWTSDPLEALDYQDELQTLYTGGTVHHMYLGQSISDSDSVKALVKAISTNYRIPYFTITPTFSVCPIHGYIAGEHEYCPKCDVEIQNKIKNNADKKEKDEVRSVQQS